MLEIIITEATFFFYVGFLSWALGYSRKKKQGFEDMEFPGVLRK